MRDIRDDLRSRLASVAGAYADDMRRFDDALEQLHKERRQAIETFQRERSTIEAMLEIEDRRHAGGAILPPAKQPPLTLRDFIIARIEHGGPIDKEQLHKQVVQAGFGESGRAFNMTLQNVANGDRVKKLPDGRFSKRSSTLFSDVWPPDKPMTQ